MASSYQLSDFLGLTEEGAVARAAEVGVLCRTTERDGRAVPRRPSNLGADRVNLAVRDGRVVGVKTDDGGWIREP